MASFSIQFHATLSELVDFVESWLKEHGVHAAAVHAPFRAEAITATDVRDALSQPSVRSVIFTERPTSYSASTGNELIDINAGCLLLDLGRLGDRGLEESCLNTMQATAVWKKIATNLKHRTSAGAIGVHEKTGASAFYRTHRLTAGARTLSEKGTALRPFAQSPIVFRPDG